MAKDDTLKKIYSEIEAGDLGKARDRLNGLLLTYPNDIQIRELLADVYWRLQFPAMAGRYWYLTETSGEHVETARIAFEKSFGNDPARIMAILKLSGDPDKLPEQVQSRFEVLQKRKIEQIARREVLAKAVKEPKAKSPCKLLLFVLLFLIAILLVTGFMCLGINWFVESVF
ncbi:MAG: DUF6584 family protein [Anaerolineaceae bacterium]|jgi:hypothetical protein